MPLVWRQQRLAQCNEYVVLVIWMHYYISDTSHLDISGVSHTMQSQETCSNACSTCFCRCGRRSAARASSQNPIYPLRSAFICSVQCSTKEALLSSYYDCESGTSQVTTTGRISLHAQHASAYADEREEASIVNTVTEGIRACWHIHTHMHRKTSEQSLEHDTVLI